MAYGQTADLSRLYGLMGKIMVSVRCQYKKHAMLSTVGSTNDLWKEKFTPEQKLSSVIICSTPRRGGSRVMFRSPQNISL